MINPGKFNVGRRVAFHGFVASGVTEASGEGKTLKQGPYARESHLTMQIMSNTKAKCKNEKFFLLTKGNFS